MESGNRENKQTVNYYIDGGRIVGFFLYKIESCNNSMMHCLFDVFCKYDLQILLTKYNITGLCSPRRFRFLACNWLCFLFFVCLCVFSMHGKNN